MSEEKTYKYKTYQEICEEEGFKQKEAIFKESNNIFDMYEMYCYVIDRLGDCEEYYKRLEEYFDQFIDVKDIPWGLDNE